MVEFDRLKAWKVHAVCAVLHFVSTIVIAALALKNGSKASDYETYVNKDFFTFTDWNIFCYKNGTYSIYIQGKTSDTECPDSSKLFFINRGTNSFETPINILYVALAFTSVSASVHAVSAIWSACSEKYNLAIDSLLRFSVDYAVSAPLMLSLVNIVYGANCVSGVIVGPAVLCAALVASAWLLFYALSNPAYQNSDDSKAKFSPLLIMTRRLFPYMTSKTKYIVIFTFLVAIYCASLAPTFAAIINAGKLAPTSVVIFMSGLLVFYSSFIVPYALELFKKKTYSYFLSYAILSLVAKAVLHSFLAVSVLQQAKLYDNAKVNVTDTGLEPPEDMTAQNADAFIIIFVTPTIGILLGLVFKFLKLDPITATKTIFDITF